MIIKKKSQVRKTNFYTICIFLNNYCRYLHIYIHIYTVDIHKAWKKFQEVIVEYKKTFVPNLAVLQLGSIKSSFKKTFVYEDTILN